MKKKFFATFLSLVLVIVFCSCIPKTYADENVKTDEVVDTTEETTETTTEETEQEGEAVEEVTFREMFKDFLNKYLSAIITTITGVPMSMFVYLFFRKKIKKMSEEVINSSILSKEEKDKSIEVLNKANEKVDKAIEKFDIKAEEFEEINKKAEEVFQKFEKRENELFEKFRISQELNTKLFSILAIVVSQNSNLCNEGYAKQLLELMETKTDEKEGE